MLLALAETGPRLLSHLFFTAQIDFFFQCNAILQVNGCWAGLLCFTGEVSLKSSGSARTDMFVLTSDRHLLSVLLTHRCPLKSNIRHDLNLEKASYHYHSCCLLHGCLSDCWFHVIYSRLGLRLLLHSCASERTRQLFLTTCIVVVAVRHASCLCFGLLVRWGPGGFW